MSEEVNIDFAIQALKLAQILEEENSDQLDELTLTINERLQIPCINIKNFQYKILIIKNLLEQSTILFTKTNKNQYQEIAQLLQNQLNSTKKEAETYVKNSDSKSIQYSFWKLHKKIIKLPSIKPDYFTTGLLSISEKITLVYQKQNVVPKIINILPQLINPNEFFQYGEEESNKLIKNLIDKINEILLEGNITKTDKNSGIISKLLTSLQLIKLTYEKFHRVLSKNNKEEIENLKKPKSKLQGVGISHFQIDQDVAMELLCINEEGISKKQNLLGTHAICCKDNVFYKPNPIGRAFIGPEHEFAIYSFYSLLGEENAITPTILLKIDDIQLKNTKNKYGRVLQGGLGVSGMLLSDMIGLIELFPLFERSLSEIKAEELFKDIYEEKYFLEYQNTNPDFKIEKINQKTIDEKAKLILSAYETHFEKIDENERFDEFYDLERIRIQDIYINIDNRSCNGIIHLLSLLHKYPEICYSIKNNQKKRNSFIYFTDCIDLILKIKKNLFSNLTLQEIIFEIKNLYSKFDCKNFSAHFISSLLTNPRDHKSENLMVQIEKTEENKIKTLKIIGIDNDLALDTKEEEIHSILFCFTKQMNEKLHNEIKSKLLSKSPEEFIFNWLISLEYQNQEYNKLINQKIITNHDLFENHDERCLFIPLEISVHLIQQMYIKIQKIYQLLHENQNNLTHQQLFDEILPILSKAYKKSIQENENHFELIYNRVCNYIDDNFFKNSSIIEKEMFYSSSDAIIEFLFTLVSFKSISFDSRVHLIGKAIEFLPSYSFQLFSLFLDDDSKEEILFLCLKYNYCNLLAFMLENEKIKYLQNHISSIELNFTEKTQIQLPILCSTNKKGQNSLLIACDSLSIDLIYILIEKYNCKTNVLDSNHMDCIGTTLNHFQSNPSKVTSILFTLAKNSNDILWNHLYGVNKESNLHRLVYLYENNPHYIEKLIKFFIKHGASPDIKNKLNKTPFDLSIQFNYPRLIKLFIQLNAGSILDIHSTINYFTFTNTNMNEIFQILLKNSLLLRWNLTLNELRNSNKQKNHPLIQLQSSQFGFIHLSKEISNQLFENNNLKSNLQHYGRRKVQNINFSLYDNSNDFELYFKQYPEIPGLEFAVSYLFEILIGHGTSYSDLTKCILSKNKSFPLLISQGIHGENLHDILKNPIKTKDFHDHLDHKYFSELFLTSLLVNFEDAKPDNFIIEKLPNSGKYRIIGIDNDHSFVPPIKKTKKTQQTIEKPKIILVKNIIYCLNNMNEPIHPFAIEKFLSFNIKEILSTWINKLIETENNYKKIFSDKEFKNLIKENKKDNHCGVCLQIPITNEILIEIYQKFQRLQNILKENQKSKFYSKKLTCLEVLRLVIPVLGSYYEDAFFKFINNPLDRFYYLTSEQYGLAKTGRLETLINTRSMLKSLKIETSLTSLNPFSNKKQINLPSLLSLLNELENKSLSSLDERKRIYNEIINENNYLEFKKIQLDIEKEKFIVGIRNEIPPLTCKDKTQEQQKNLLKIIIKNGNYRNFIFDYCEFLDKNLFLSLANESPSLYRLYFSNINNNDHLNFCFNKFNLFKYLIEIKLENITLTKTSSSSSSSSSMGKKRKSKEFIVKFPLDHIRHISIINCNFTCLYLPDCLKTLVLKNCFQLSRFERITLHIDCILLDKIYIENCFKLEWKQGFSFYLKSSASEKFISLQKVPLFFDAYLPMARIEMIKSILYLQSKEKSSLMIKSLFNYYYQPDFGENSLFSFEDLLIIFSSLKRITMEDPFITLSNAISDEFQNITKLNILQYNSLQRHINTERIQIIARKFINLMDLNLDGCIKITDDAIIEIAKNCKKIQILSLHNCYKLTDLSIKEITTNCLDLISLNVSFCSKITDISLDYISSSCNKLTHLLLPNCYKITDKGLIHVANNSNSKISVLNVSNIRNITDNGISAILSSLPLIFLNISNCIQITSKAFEQIGSCKETIIHYDFSGCKNLDFNVLHYIIHPTISHLDLNSCLSLFKNENDWNQFFQLIINTCCKNLTFLNISNLTNFNYSISNYLNEFSIITNKETNLSLTLNNFNFIKGDEKKINEIVQDNDKIIIHSNVFHYSSNNTDIDDGLISLCNNLYPYYINNHYFFHKPKSFSLLKPSTCLTLSYDPSITNHTSFIEFSSPIHVNLYNCMNVIDKFIDELVSNTYIKGFDLSNCIHITNKSISQLMTKHLLSNESVINLSNCILLDNEALDAIYLLVVNTLNYNVSLNFSGCTRITGSNIFKNNENYINFNCRSIEFSNCIKLNDQGIKSILELSPSIEQVCLNNCISLQNILFTSNSSAIWSLNLSNCHLISSFTFNLIANHLKNLQIFQISYHSTISDEIFIQIIKSCPYLNTIEIVHCFNLSNLSIFAISEYCENIIDLSCSYCPKINDDGLISLCNNSNIHLQVIDFSNLLITDKILDSLLINSKNSLNTINFAYCFKLTSNAINNFIKQTNLTIINLLGCKLDLNVLINTCNNNKFLQLLLIDNNPIKPLPYYETLIQSSPYKDILLEDNKFDNSNLNETLDSSNFTFLFCPFLFFDFSNIILGKFISHLDISGCFIDFPDLLADHLKELIGLKQLCLSYYHNFNTKLCETIGALPILQKLDISNSKNLNDSHLKSIGNYNSYLEEISLENCDQITNTGLMFFVKKFFILIDINISGCNKISDDGLDAIITASPCLRNLSISGTISDNCIHKLVTSCVGLQCLSFINCPNLTNQSLNSISSCTLSSLQIVNNKLITSFGLSSVCSNQSLRELILVDCPKLTYLPQVSSRLDILVIRGCNKFRLPGKIEDYVNQTTSTNGYLTLDKNNVTFNIRKPLYKAIFTHFRL